jgi:cystathionine gamma-lyase
MKDQKYRIGTRAIHAGQEPEPITGAVMVPVFQTSTYAQKSPGVHTGFEYARTHNPTRQALEDCIASLEHAAHGVAFASGLATTNTILQTLKAGDHVICSDDVYGGTFRLFDKVLRRFGLNFTFIDLTDLAAVERAFQASTKLLWIETPTNPMLKILDIQSLSALAHAKGAKVVVDSTFMSPVFQNPLRLGADIVMHSSTKYLNGHSDVIGGIALTNDPEIAKDLRFLQNASGAVPGPWDCFLILRGLKTLHVRMAAHQENAVAIAKHLEKHPKVEAVIYPGLTSHPQHELAKKQMAGFGGMMSVRIRGGASEANQFLKKLKLFTLAESLGGVESLVEIPSIMTHASIPPETRKALGITDNLIRFSVGIEDPNDLIEDIENGLAEI